MSLNEIADWIIDHANAGADIIIVDPITAAKPEGKMQWQEDMAFLFRVKQIIRKTGCRLMLFSHPRTGKVGEMSLDGIAGGAAYPRFSHTVIWIKHFDQIAESTVFLKGGIPQVVSHKQIFKVLKARNSNGGVGMAIAADLCKDTSCMLELGLIDTRKDLGENARKDEDFALPTIKDGKQLHSPKQVLEDEVEEDRVGEFIREFELSKPKPKGDPLPILGDFDEAFLERERIKDTTSICV